VGAESRLAELCGHLSTLRSYPKSAFLYQQGELSTRFYQLVSGRVRILLGTPEGREHVLAIVEPGGLFGEAACFDGLPYHTSSITVQPSTVRVFPREAILAAMRTGPEVTLEILRSITRKQRLFALQIESATFKRAPARVAFILSRLATFYGVPLPGSRGTRIALHLSHEVLASMIGVTRVTVTREIGALIRDHVIARDGRHLVVRQPARLLERAQQC
jgi:CRP/FNR family cyclic AMP-dependent transcriptional regulator